MQKLLLKLGIDYTHMGDWREHPYEQMYHEYYILGNYTTMFIRYSFFSTEKRIKRNKNFNRRLRRLLIFLFLILIFWENEGQKGGIDNPHLLSISKNKNITFYIYHHIDTQPTESHLADRTLSPRLAITTHRTDLNNLFVTFFCLVNSLL